MAIYSLGVLTTGTASGAAAWEIRAAAAPAAYRLLEIGIYLNAATASLLGLGIPAAIGVTPTTPVTFLDESEQSGKVAVTTSALAWGTGPTVPTNFFRRISLPAAVGVGVIWQFPRGLQILGGSSVVVWNLQLNSALQAYAVIEE